MCSEFLLRLLSQKMIQLLPMEQSVLLAVIDTMDAVCGCGTDGAFSLSTIHQDLSQSPLTCSLSNTAEPVLFTPIFL